jgi:hypothetical protein
LNCGWRNQIRLINPSGDDVRFDLKQFPATPAAFYR